jgi:hypothetical protein
MGEYYAEDLCAPAGARLGGQSIAVQVGAMGIEPSLGALEVGVEPLDKPPEAWRVVELLEMGDLVRR